MARQIVRNTAFVSLFTAGSLTTAFAQPTMNRGPNPNAPHLMVSACRTSDKVLAILCADKIRTQIEGDVSFRVLYVHPKTDVENVLSASGYDPAAALAAADAVALAKQIRADMYIDATVDKSGNDFKVTAAVVLSRDANLIQPLGSFSNVKIEGVAQQVARAYRDVFEKTFEQSRDCFSLARERKTVDAQKKIADALKNYPASVWARMCNYQLLKDTRAPQADVLKVAEELLTIQPENKSLLRELVLMYDAKGDKVSKIKLLQQLLAADPTDAKLTADVINSLAEEGKLDEALVAAQQANTRFQGDLNIIKPYWLILTAKKQYKTALDVGKQMVLLDSSAADTAYFSRSVAAAATDSNYAEAAKLSEQAAAKFPKITDFWNYCVSFYRRAGNPGASTACARKALATDPKMPGMRAGLGQYYTGLKTEAGADSATTLVREMIANNEDKLQIAGIAVSAGDALRLVADAIKPSGADSLAQVATKREKNLKAFTALAWSDTLAKGVTAVQAQAKFLLGVAALNLAQDYMNLGSDPLRKAGDELRAMKPVPDAAKQNARMAIAYAEGCPMLAKANDYIVMAQLALPAGGAFAPDAMRQTMQGAMQVSGYIDQLKGRCPK